MGIRRGVLMSALALALLCWAGVSGAAVNFSITPIESGTLSSSDNIRTDGAWVVYDSVAILPGATHGIVARNLKTATNTAIGGVGDQVLPDVSMDRVVYEDQGGASSDVRVYDLRESTDVGVATSAGDEVAPRIGGDLVVWLNTTTGELWYKNLRNGTTDVVAGPPAVLDVYDVDGGRIVWVEDGRQVYALRPGTDSVPVEVDSHADMEEHVNALSLHGDYLSESWTNDGIPRITGIRLSSGAKSLSSPGGDPGSPRSTTFHGTTAWQTDSGVSLDISWQATMAPTAAGATSITTAATDEHEPSMFGHRIVWSDAAGLGNVSMASAVPETVRTEGADRYATAAAASRNYFAAAHNAVLCTGLNFPDAIAAAPFARVVAGPLLLSRTAEVPPVTMAELDRLGVTHVFIIGGTNALTSAVKAQLEGAGMTTERISGADRYETANDIAARIVDAGNSAGTYDGTAFFARGDKFPDALAVGPVAAQAGAPVFLVQPTVLPDSVAAAVRNLNIEHGFIVGGEAAVSAEVRSEIEGIMVLNGGPGDPTERWADDDRYSTAVEIIKRGLDWRYIDLDTLGLATGENFPDALGGGAALGFYGSGIALTQKAELPASLIQLLADEEYRIGRLDVFGGSDVVKDTVMTGVAARLK